MSAAEWTDTYSIHHWRILKKSYRKLAWAEFEPTNTEFGLESLTHCAIRPWAQLAVRANFVQLLQFNLFAQYSGLISAIDFITRHICFKQNVAPVDRMSAARRTDTIVFTTKGFWEVAIESWPEWDLKPRPLNFIESCN